MSNSGDSDLPILCVNIFVRSTKKTMSNSGDADLRNLHGDIRDFPATAQLAMQV